MIPYVALLGIPLLLQTVLMISHRRIRFGHNNGTVSAENIALPTFFFLFLLLLALRADTVGRDLPNYSDIFRSIGWMSLESILAQPRELVFNLYCWFTYHYISSDFQVFLALTACLSVLPIAYVYNRDKSHGYLKIAVFVNMSTFVMLFSGIRQGLAMSIGLLAYQALKKHKTWKFLLWVVIGMLVHHTGFMIIFLYPLYKMRFRKRDLLWILPCILFVVAYNQKIFNILTAFMGSIDELYSAAAGSTGSYGSFLLFALFTVFCYVVSDDSKMDEEAFALRNILMFATVLQSFAALNSLAMRMNYYFILLIPHALGKSLQFVKPGYKQVAKLGEAVIAFFFSMLFLFTTYRSYVTGISALDTIPYIPFWKG